MQVSNETWENALRTFMDAVATAHDTGQIQRIVLKLEDETRLIVMVKKVINDLN